MLINFECSLKLDDQAVRVAVGLRMGLNLWVRHHCHCGSLVDARGLHSFVWKKSPGQISHASCPKWLVTRSFASGGLPVLPSDLFRTDGKRPDGLTRVPWRSGKSLCFDVTVICPLADSFVSGTAPEARAAAEVAASRKTRWLGWPCLRTNCCWDSRVFNPSAIIDANKTRASQFTKIM